MTSKGTWHHGRPNRAGRAAGAVSRPARNREDRRRSRRAWQGAAVARRGVHRAAHAHARAVHARADGLRDLHEPVHHQTHRRDVILRRRKLRRGRCSRRSSGTGLAGCCCSASSRCPSRSLSPSSSRRSSTPGSCAFSRFFRTSSSSRSRFPVWSRPSCGRSCCCPDSGHTPSSRKCPRPGQRQLLLEPADPADDHPHRHLGVHRLQHDDPLHLAQVDSTRGDRGGHRRGRVAAGGSSCASSCRW